MTDDEQDAKDWAAIKRFFDLKSTFIRASQATARDIHSPVKAAVVTALTGAAGLFLALFSVKTAVLTAMFAIGTVLSVFTFNPLPVLALGACAMAAGAVSSVAAKGAAWLLGAAKGAFLDAKCDNSPAAKAAVVPVVENNAPSAGLSAKPVANDFNRKADPATASATTEIKPVQPEQPRGPGAPAP